MTRKQKTLVLEIVRSLVTTSPESEKPKTPRKGPASAPNAMRRAQVFEIAKGA
jgi:hypothetical protein